MISEFALAAALHDPRRIAFVLDISKKESHFQTAPEATWTDDDVAFN